MPTAKSFGSYAGRLVIARISPVFGSRKTAAPASPVRVKRVLERVLQVVVDRELQALAVDRRLLAELLDLAARRC